MKSQKIISAIILILTFIAFLFATPAVDVEVFGKQVKWDGLNLATISNDKYTGEMQFEDGLDVRGGKRYLLQAEMPEHVDKPKHKRSFAKDLANGFATRLKDYGFIEFDLKWWNTENEVTVELTLANNSENADDIIRLLAARGEIKFWTVDPNYTPGGGEVPGDLTIPDNIELPEGVEFGAPEGIEGSKLNNSITQQTRAESDEPVTITGDEGIEVKLGEESPVQTQPQSQNPLEGMMVIELGVSDLRSARAEFGANTNGYGLRLKFKDDRETFLQGMIAGESGKTTMMTVDGQFMAYRGASDPNIEPDYTALYMLTNFDQSFDLNDALVTLIHTEKLEVSLGVIEINEVNAQLGENYESDFKLATSLALLLLSGLLIFRYRFMGMLIVVNMIAFVVWDMFFLKLFNMQLTLSAIIGSMLGLIFFMLVCIDFVTRLKTHRREPLRKLKEEIKVIQKNYRNLYSYSLVIAMIFTLTALEYINQISAGFGIGVIIGIVLLYSLFRSLLPIAYLQQLNYETKKSD